MRNLTIELLMFIAIFAFFTVSCTSEGKKEAKTEQKPAVEEKKAEPEKKNIEYPIPTPFEITKMLNDAGASYIIDLSNPLENAEKYMTEASKALNLGVYGADLSYSSTYKKTENTRMYMAQTQKMTEELGISSAINQNLVERVETNINNSDSLYSIISSSYYDTFDFLNQHGKGAVSVLVLTGGWVEGLYISSQLQKTAQNKEAINAGIAKQKSTYDELSVLLRAYKDKDKGVADIFDELSKFKEDFDKVDENTALTNEQVSSLTAKIVALRSKIINY